MGRRARHKTDGEQARAEEKGTARSGEASEWSKEKEQQRQRGVRGRKGCQTRPPDEKLSCCCRAPLHKRAARWVVPTGTTTVKGTLPAHTGKKAVCISSISSLPLPVPPSLTYYSLPSLFPHICLVALLDGIQDGGHCLPARQVRQP